MSLIIDSSVFINYGLYNKLYRIANAIVEYNLNVYANEYLLEEVERNLGKTHIRRVHKSFSLTKNPCNSSMPL